MRTLVQIVLFLGLYAFPALAFDSSEYRQSTYGPPTHYCDPTRSLANNGNGSLANPWNMTQCMTQPVAGNIVGVLPGVSVELNSTNSFRVPTFNPTNSGTANNRIVYVTKYAAVALTNVATNPNRTELRHNGTAPRANGDYEIGTGSAMYGANQRNYITYDGFFVDMAHAYPKGDTGVIRVENATGVHFRNFEIKGTTTNMQSNPVIYRPQNAVDTVLSNFRTYDFINDTTGSNVPQAALFSDQYGDQNFLIEHFEIRNTQRGIFLKGTAPGPVFNYGTIRYGVVSDVSSCYQFNDLHPFTVTTLEYSLCYDVNWGAGIIMSSETTAARNLLIHHNTVARVNSSSINTNGGIYSRANGIASNVVIRDNLIELNNGTFGHAADFGEISNLPTTLNYNAYYKNGSTITWSYSGSQFNGLSSWRSATGRDTNGQVLSSGPFIDRNNRNFRITNGHAAKTASSTGGEVGAYAGNRTVGVDINSGDTGDASAPSPPTGLRIQ